MKYTIIFLLFASILSAQTVDENGNEIFQSYWKLDTKFNRSKYKSNPTIVFFSKAEWIDQVVKDKKGKPVSITKGIISGKKAPMIKTGRTWKVNDYKKELKEIYGIEIPNNINSFKEINIWLEENGIEL